MNKVNVLMLAIVLAMLINVVGMIVSVNKLNQLIIITGAATGTATATVSSVTTISLPTSTVAFGNMANSENNDTSDNKPASFLVQNDGTVTVNVSVNGTTIWNSTTVNTTNPYIWFKCGDTSEGACNNTQDQTTYRVLNATSYLAFWNLSYVDTNDTREVDINLTVPSDEPAGSKVSTVDFRAVATSA